MSTQLATIDPRQEANRIQVTSAFGDSAGFDVSQRIARALASSSIVPKEYQGNVANVLVAMEYAHRIGASVLAVMQNLDIIHGRPALRSTFLIATVNASGRFTPLRFRWQGTEGKDDWGCRAVAKDLKSGEECPGTLITIAMAKAEGWYQKNGSKYKTMPEHMLMYRSAAFWTRVYCPEHTLGMQTVEEAEEIASGPYHAFGSADLNERLAIAAPTEADNANGPGAVGGRAAASQLEQAKAVYEAALFEHRPDLTKDDAALAKWEENESGVGRTSGEDWGHRDYMKAAEALAKSEAA